ncbi:hypothetical protein ACS0TY_019522 [Phlomoides rotata]
MKRLPNLENAYGFIDDPLKQSCITFTNSLLADLNLRKTLGRDENGQFVAYPNPLDRNLPHLNYLYPEPTVDEVDFLIEFVNEFLAEIPY